MQWYYAKNGGQLGPVAESELRAKLASGEVSPKDLVWNESMAEWRPAAQVAALVPPPPPLPMSVPPPVPPLSGGGEFSGESLGQRKNVPMAVSPMSNGADISSYLWQSIVVTLFCCWPFGIPAIVYAAKVDGLKSRGDFAAARAASASAKMWCVVSVGIALMGIILWGIVAAIAYPSVR